MYAVILFMIEKFFLWFVSFFGLVSVFGIYLGYLHLIYAQLSFLVIVFCAVVSYFVVRGMKGVNVRHSRELSIILLVLLALDVYVSLPYMIYPHSYVDFGLNVAQGRLITDMHGFPDFVHVYPNVYYAVFAMFNSIVLHAYTVSSAVAIIMQVMTAFAVFLVGREVFDEKTGLIASFLYGFSLVNILLLEQGYLTQSFAAFFFASSMYLVIMCCKDRRYGVPLVLSLACLLSYPHYFAVMFFAVLVYFRKVLKYLLVAIGVMGIEILGMFSHYFTHTTTLFNSFVMYGGIIVPNLFVLSIFVFSVVGYFKLRKVRPAGDLISFTNALVFIISVFVFLFLVNYFIFSISAIVERNVRQLYMVVKLLYLLFVPFSLLAAFWLRGFAKKYCSFAMIFFVLYFAFFAGYLLVLPEKNNLPPEMYFMSETLSELNGYYDVGFDDCVLQDGWVQPWIYDTLYGRPDNYTEFSMAELGFLLQSSFVENKEEGHSRCSEGIRVTFVSHDVDYFVAACDYLNESLYYSVGEVRVYALS